MDEEGSTSGAGCLIPRLVILTEIIAPYRIPIFNALARRPQLNLHVVFLSENDPSMRQWRVYADEIEFSYDVLPSWRRRLGKYNTLINGGVFSILNKIRPNAILCGGYNYLASWQAAYWARLHSLPLLLWSESTALDQRQGHPPVEFLKAHFLRSCRAFVVPGKSSLQYLEGFGIPDQRIFIAPNAVDIALFSAPAQEARRKQFQVRAHLSLPSRYFLYVGRLVKAKGVFELLETYAQLDTKVRSEVGLVFVGDGRDRAELMARALQIGTGIIQFPGFLQREELPDFYALADALVFPTHSDPWGLVVNEAMSCGLPIIASSVAGCVADLVQDGWNGFIVSRKDPGQMAAAMVRLASDSDLRMQMGSRSRQRIEAYSPEAWADGLVNAMESICEWS